MTKFTEAEKEQNRKKYIESRTGDLVTHSSLIAEEFRYRVNRLSQLIGDVHELSLGEYKESLLREYLSKFLPRRYAVGTGFVMFGSNSGELSRQLDIIVYDETNYPVIFKDNAFVILRPESVRAVVEVKGFLDRNGIFNFMDLFIDFAKKWKGYCDHHSGPYFPKIKKPCLMTMAWDIAIDTDGRPKTDGKKLREIIVEKYKADVDKAILGEHFPVLQSAYIYSNCCVSGVISVGENDDVEFGYRTGRGQFLREVDGEGLVLAGDKTLADLLGNIFVYLETPFNPFFTWTDSNIAADHFIEDIKGTENWLHGDEVDLVVGSRDS